MTTVPVDAVLWDFGGVFTPSPFAHVRAIGPELGTTGDHLLELVFGPYDRDTDHPWHRVERGELSLDDARVEIGATASAEGIELDLWDVLVRMGDGADMVDPDVLRAARDVRERGLTSALVTNNVLEFRDGWRRLVPVDDLFSVVVDSSEVGMRKPDPAIFHHALAGLGGCPPHRAVFLDDHPGNVGAAEAVGLQAILVPEVDRATAIPELFALLDGG